ncbi:MAG: hypothetical protein HeimC2_26480 [Candidatus Heimdallarchaeota archaeon LC_2]|nr:MAG: hypothetical protein HeimC2_26480 [Candidatus Heimdallarchaeota archaeon LC_2]
MQVKTMKENLIKELQKLAMEDGIETTEETDIISNVILNFDKFNDCLELAREDNKITYKEKTECWRSRRLCKTIERRLNKLIFPIWIKYY